MRRQLVVPGHQHYKLPRLPLDELHSTVNHRKRSADSIVAAHFRAQNVIFGGGARMWGRALIRVSAIQRPFSIEVIVLVQEEVSAIQN